jgi:hypothetical protein
VYKRQRSISVASKLAAASLLLAACVALTSCGQELAPAWSETKKSTIASNEPTVVVGNLLKPKPVAMGTAATTGKWKLVVSTAARSATAAGVRATEGREMLVVTAELTNGANASREVSSTCFQLADEGGTVHKPVPTNDAYYLYDQSVEMGANATKRVVIAYAIPVGVGPFTWTFTPPDRVDDSQPPAVLAVE